MTADGGPAGPGFATLLRQRRRAAGLTQLELAGLAGLAVRTVREAERGRTARPQRTTAVLLADALGLAGRDRAGFLTAARGDAVPSAGAPPVALGGPARLPPPPVLEGRDTELAQLGELLRTGAGAGPLALVGVAGVGKSALALALAHRVSDDFPGGVVGVATDQDSVASEVLDAVGTVFGVPHADQLTPALAAALTGAPAVLLLDGVDQAPAELRQVLGALPPGLQVITTGRAPLGVPGERVWPVAPLALPPAGLGPELAAATAYPAAALFVRRLARVRPEPLAPDEVPALVGLVRRLGGLPLALELAAGHGRLLRLPEILQRYGDRVLDLGEGHDTLRAAVAGSYRLLSPAEQPALRRLAMFRGRWSVALAEALLTIDGAADDPLPLLDRLVSLGLVAVSGPREHRFRMLDVVRDFAIEQSERAGELPGARRAHAQVLATFVERVSAEPERAAGLGRIDDVAGEVWAALTHAANDDPPTALRLAAHLPRWWRVRGRDRVGRQWLRRLLADPRTEGVAPSARAWAMVGVARLAHQHGEGVAEQPAAMAAVREFARLGEVGGQLAAARVVAMVSLAAGAYERAREHSQAGLSLACRHGRHRDAAIAQLGLVWHEIRRADLGGARRRLAAVDRLGAQAGDQRLRRLATAGLAEVSRLAGRYERAVAISQRVLAVPPELTDPSERERVFGTLGGALAALGRVEEAEQVLVWLRRASSGTEPPGACAMIEARLALARGDQELAAEWFGAAVAGFAGGALVRERIEALVELAGCLTDPASRKQVAEQLDGLREQGFRLFDREQALLAAASLG